VRSISDEEETVAGHRIVVVGSSNMDLVVRVPRLPAPGETLSGTDFRTLPGGKGANQAVAAARMGASVSFVACVGDDAFGAELSAGLARDGIDISHVRRLSGVPTGIACIAVDDGGRNSIMLVPGANAALDSRHVHAAEPLLADAAALVCQLEVPLEAVAAAIEAASRQRVTVILNPAPARQLDMALLGKVDFLVPNESEASLLSGIPVTDVESARRAAAVLRERGPRHVIVTLGAQGAWIAAPDAAFHLPAPRVNAVDTTAAGDTFIGGFAAALAAGADLRAAVALGQRAAAVSVTRFGAQASIPYRHELDAIDTR
jgi:ribokinase